VDLSLLNILLLQAAVVAALELIPHSLVMVVAAAQEE